MALLWYLILAPSVLAAPSLVVPLKASFVAYALNKDGTPNTFSQNLISEITGRTGGKALIRLGGTSSDYVRYLPRQETPALPRAEVTASQVYNYQDIGGTTIGPSYWDLCRSFPDALYIIQTPLANSNVSETIAWAKSAVEHIGIDKLHSFEPGNEPDLYPATSLGPPSFQGQFTNETYTGNFTEYAAAIANAVALPASAFFQAFDVGVHLGNDEAAEGWKLDVPTVFGLGLDIDTIVKTVAHHYYQTQGGSAATLASGLMTRSKMVAHLDRFKPAIEWLKKNKPSVSYVLSEIGNSLSPTHDYNYQATLGSALWQIMHSGFDLWLPVPSGDSQPQVFSNYYAQPFVTDFVGKSGTAQAAQLSLPGETTGNWAAYGAFEAGVLKRLAILNMNYWNRTSSSSARASQTVTVHVPNGVRNVKVDLLSSPEGAGAKADSITYAGSQWTYEGLGKEVKDVRNDSQILQVKDGAVPITIYQSSAALIHLWSLTHSKMGSLQADRKHN